MPRTARIDYPDLLQHVIVRGVNRCDIFVDDADRKRFLERLSSLLVDTETECFAWSLMTNHVHLLLRPRKSGLAPLMRRLLTGYAIYFNRRHGRSGHLFQNRYKSIVCEEDSYLLELVRYIHLNPLRAGLVDDLSSLDHYPWSGHAALMGGPILDGQTVDKILHLFAEGKGEGRKRYHAFVADGIEKGKRDDLVGGRRRTAQSDTVGDEEVWDSRILGGEAFARELRQKQELAQHFSDRVEVGEIIKQVCDLYGVDPSEIGKNNRTALIAKIRSIICYLAVREAGHSGVEVARHVNLGRAGVSHAVARGARDAESDAAWLKLLDD